MLTGAGLLASRAHAQTSFSIGPRVGLNLATYHLTEPEVFDPPQYRAGLEAGVASALSRGHFALQGALLYSQKGYKTRTTVDIRSVSNSYLGTGEVEYAERLHYLTLPLALAYTQRSDGQGFQVFAGPYVGLFLAGSFTNSTTPQNGPSSFASGSLTAAPEAAYDYGSFVRRYDAGLQGGLGYRYQQLLFQAGYSLGLRNVSAEAFQLLRAPRYNRAFQASLSYLLGPKKG
ncbi:hypothetical protein GCM10027345_35990 [Hymenobacter daeguensis]